LILYKRTGADSEDEDDDVARVSGGVTKEEVLARARSLCSSAVSVDSIIWPYELRRATVASSVLASCFAARLSESLRADKVRRDADAAWPLVRWSACAKRAAVVRSFPEEVRQRVHDAARRARAVTPSYATAAEHVTSRLSPALARVSEAAAFVSGFVEPRLVSPLVIVDGGADGTPYQFR
jgi:hypothetical protein